jgi:hypothetical protein
MKRKENFMRNFNFSKHLVLTICCTKFLYVNLISFFLNKCWNIYRLRLHSEFQLLNWFKSLCGGWWWVCKHILGSYFGPNLGLGLGL